MNASFPLRIAALSTLALSTLSVGTTFAPQPVEAAQFGQREVRQQNFVAVAAPVGETGRHQLLILEQVSSSRPCWAESGATPTVVDPLLLDFDFTGVCGRATDSNGFSIRAAGQDLGIQYSLRVVRRGNDIALLGVPFRPNQPTLELGRTQYTNDFVRLDLHPGWRFTKRTYQGRTLGHVYLTNDLTLSQLADRSTPVATNPTAPSSDDREIPTQPTEDRDWRDEIELTDAQAQEIATIRQRYLAENGRLQGQLETARRELQERTLGNASNRQVRRQRKVVENLREDISDLRFDSIMEIREVLSLEQRTAFAELMDLQERTVGADEFLTTMLR
ncbi:MAG: DUF3747 domain-containing protein [Cyanobacteria bacterium SID2]|nr:DUF3747 domain-containing protein [Cyanobacteria bacterium SID2]MBP0006173.1 DUF3747 domain-containing protein [Cyanobacteria bacterium SBC]